jgi:hypothetical protein
VSVNNGKTIKLAILDISKPHSLGFHLEKLVGWVRTQGRLENQKVGWEGISIARRNQLKLG